MNNQSKLTKFFLGFQAVLLVGMLAVLLLTASSNTLNAICSIVVIAYISFYAIALYKEPHGNYLKAAVLLWSLMLIINVGVCACAGVVSPLQAILRLLCAAAACYAAGRLDRVKENIYIFSAIEAVLVFAYVVFLTKAKGLPVLTILRQADFLVMFTTLFIAYVTRFNEHKLAGKQ